MNIKFFCLVVLLCAIQQSVEGSIRRTILPACCCSDAIKLYRDVIGRCNLYKDSLRSTPNAPTATPSDKNALPALMNYMSL